MGIKITWVIIITAFGAMSSEAQLITYDSLSYKYLYKIGIIKKADTTQLVKDSIVNLYIFTRGEKLVQKISFQVGMLLLPGYQDNKNSRSYITGKNKNTEVSDYDFGDLVIADLNFDGKEDIAIKHDSGGNGGPFYNFYLQGENGYFYKSSYLTNYVCSFPKYINFRKKTLTKQIHANVHQERRDTYKYNVKTQKWRLIEWVNVEDNPLYYKNNTKQHRQNNKK